MPRKVLFMALVLYIVSTLVSYSVFSFAGKMGISQEEVSPIQEEEGAELSMLLDIDPNEPQDQPCPLNGKYYTKTEKEAWEKRRPLAVMIENHPESIPQSGLIAADIMFETVSEGGVTRFMGMYYCGVQRFDTTLAPVRSARTYFVDWASGFNWPLYVHVGGANVSGPSDALGQISDYGWVGENDLNQFSIGYPTFVRDYNRLPGREIATEHTMVTSTEKLWVVGEKRDWTNLAPERKISRSLDPGSDWQDDYEGFVFEEEKPEIGEVTKISHEFWSGYDAYGLSWEYNPDTDAYQRAMGGQPHKDLELDMQIEANSVVVLLTREKGPINEKKHMLYTTTGTGKALIFQHGQAIEANWTKKARTSELRFTTKRGADVEFARGLIWISVVDRNTEVEY